LPLDVDPAALAAVKRQVSHFDRWVNEEGATVFHRPGRARNILELPELVELARQLGDGKIPQVRKRINRLGGGALGVFRGVQHEKAIGIELRADIFQLVQPQELQRLVADAQEYADAIAQAEGLDEEQLEKVAVERFAFLAEAARKEALRNNPKLASKVLAHELGHWIDFVPENMIPGRGNVLARIASMVGYLKHELAATPESGVQPLTKTDRNRLRSRAREIVKQDGHRPKDAGFNQLVNAEAKKLMAAERKRLGIVTLEDVQQEARPLIAWWRGTRTMEDYFKLG